MKKKHEGRGLKTKRIVSPNQQGVRQANTGVSFLFSIVQQLLLHHLETLQFESAGFLFLLPLQLSLQSLSALVLQTCIMRNQHASPLDRTKKQTSALFFAASRSALSLRGIRNRWCECERVNNAKFNQVYQRRLFLYLSLSLPPALKV
jgi:hypothetical protein